MRSFHRIVGVGLVALLVGCGSKGSGGIDLPPCQNDDDCPAGQVCLATQQGSYCFLPPDGGQPAPDANTGGTPNLETSADELDFGNPNLGSSIDLDLIVSNTGTAELLIFDLTIIEDDQNVEFFLSAPPERPIAIAPGGDITLTVSLNPIDGEIDNGYLLIASNDVARAALLIPLMSALKGVPELEVCVDVAAPVTNCADPAELNFGLVNYGSSAERIARLTNQTDGNAVVTVEDIAVPGPPITPAVLFDYELFILEDDPGNPGQLIETPTALPYLLGPAGTTPDLYMRLTFTADIDRSLPGMLAAFETDDASTTPTEVPILWTIAGCPPGQLDLDPGLPGCEYQCPIFPGVAELCNDIDDDCDGVVDNGFDRTSDPQNCGFCGNACILANASSDCQSSLCVITSCNAGFENVNGDPSDGCEYSCPVFPTQAETCNSLDDDCDGQVDEDFNLQTDPLNCGTCGTDCLVQGLVCSGGNCVLTCPPGTLLCAGSCVDTDTDPAHCGGCNQACNFANAQDICISATCVMGLCDPQYKNLDGLDANGCEYQCPVFPTAAESCNGVDDDCDGQIDETFDFQNDPANCNGCGNACVYPNAQGLCNAGACTMGSCNPGYRNNNGSDVDGCEYQCPVAPPVAESCNGIDDNCDGQIDESFDFQNDPGHCGSCGNACTYANAQGVCVAGACQMGVCDPGFNDIDGDPSNGCEYACPVFPPGPELCNSIDDNCNGQADETFDTQNDPSNCGSCGTTCSFTNAQALCVGGGCTMGICSAGYRDNNGSDVDGCEYNCPVFPPVAELCDGTDNDCDGLVDESFDFLNDPLNCGGCGIDCSIPGTQMECVNSSCNMVGCLASYHDLNGLPADGCEYLCPTNPPDIEVCDTVDNNCDGLVDEGFDLQNDPNNCGVCGNACGANELCCSGSCIPSDNTNCGFCGRACAGGVNCWNGSCIEAGILVITELMINPAAVNDTQGEYVEVYNPTGYPINLNGFIIRDDGSDTHTITDDVMVPAGGYVVLGRNANYGSNGGVVVQYQYSGFVLGNSGDEVVIEANAIEVDRVNYTDPFDTSSRSQNLDPDFTDEVSNDTLSNWCDTSNASMLPAGDHGTPGAPNEQCP